MKIDRTETLECFSKIGYPQPVLMLDFESFFSKEVGFESQSNIEYINDPQWETLCCGFLWVTEDMDEEPFMVDGPDLPEFFEELKSDWGAELEGITVVAKNCKFDVTLMQIHHGVVPRYIIDLDDLLRFYDARMSHHLKDICKMWKLKAKGKTESFKDLHFAEIKADPDKYANLLDYTLNDIARQTEALDIVFPMVDFTAHEAFIARHTLDRYLYPRFQVDYSLATSIRLGMEHQLAKVARDYNKKMLNSDIQMTRAMGELLEEHGEKLPLKHCKRNRKGQYPNATKNHLPLIEKYGDIDSLPPGADVKKYRPTFAKDDDGCKWLQAHSDERVSKLMEARIGLKSWPGHIGKITGIVKQSRCNEPNMLRVPIVYYGCHTGRPSGNESINLLNMGSGGRGRKQHPLISQTRNVLLAPDGRLLSIVDSSQIEARKLAWLAGQSDLLDQFAHDADPYSELAKDIFQTDVWKWSEDDSEEMARFSDIMDEIEFKELRSKIKLYRGFGKDAILGCGYGMGWVTFLARCLENPFLRPYFDSGEYDGPFVKKIIDTYRKKYRKIVKFWTLVENAWKVVTKFKGQKVKLKIPATPSRLEFFHEGGSTFLKLPSGRHLRYRNATVTKDGDLKWCWGKLWGGVLTENIDQASSRDLLTFWIEQLEKDPDYDFNCNLTPYDEIVADVPKSEAEEHCKRQLEVMCTCPYWAQGMPLGAEGGLSDRYKK